MPQLVQVGHAYESIMDGLDEKLKVQCFSFGPGVLSLNVDHLAGAFFLHRCSYLILKQWMLLLKEKHHIDLLTIYL